MQYKNPLSIFTSSQIEKILSGDYKSVKKELLLQFQLEEGITIKLNGQELDKNEVLKTFESIDDNVELHAAVYQHKALLRFLEEDNMGFFRQQENFNKLKSSPYCQDISKLLHNKISSYLGKRLRKFNPKNVQVLQEVSNYTSQISAKEHSDVYVQAYQSLLTYMDRLESMVSNPFENEKNLVFKKSVESLVTIDQLNYFKYLPESFENLKIQYVMWCNDNILLPALSRESSLGSYSNTDLLTLQRAATISATQFNKDNNLEIANTIRQYIKGQKKRRFTIILIALAIFVFPKMCGSEEETKVKTNPNDKYIHGLEKVVSQNKMTTTDKIVHLEDYFGLSKPELTIGDTLEISYTCEHLPHAKRWITQLINKAIPNSPEDKKKIKLTLTDSDNDKAKLTYLIEYNEPEARYIPTSLPNSDSITLDNLLEENKTVEVVHNKFLKSKSYEESKFKIKHLRNNSFQLWTHGQTETARIDFNNQKENEETIVDEDMLYAVIRNNINNKHITIGEDIEIISDVYYFKLLKTAFMDISFCSRETDGTGRFRKLESVQEDIIKEIGETYHGLIILDEKGQTIHKQTVFRKGDLMDVIKVFPVSVTD